MQHSRALAAGAVLPSGRFAVLGGLRESGDGRDDCEAYDPNTGEWVDLPVRWSVSLGLIVCFALGCMQIKLSCLRV